MTFFFKVILPVCWLLAWGSATGYVFLHPLHDARGAVLEPSPKWAMLGFGLVGLAILWFCTVPLKRVRLDGGFLYVSNYWSEIAIPLFGVVEVRDIAWLNLRPIVVAFRRPTRFGTEVMFMPEVSSSLWSASPVAEELRRAVAAAKPGDQ